MAWWLVFIVEWSDDSIHEYGHERLPLDLILFCLFVSLFSSGNSMIPLLQYWLKKNAGRFFCLWVWVVQEIIFFLLVFVPTEPLTCFPENLGIFFQYNSSNSGRTKPIISLKMSPTSLKRILVNRVLCLTLQPHGLQHPRLPCSSLSPGVCSNSCQWCHPTISSSVPPSSPALNLSHLTNPTNPHLTVFRSNHNLHPMSCSQEQWITGV